MFFWSSSALVLVCACDQENRKQVHRGHECHRSEDDIRPGHGRDLNTSGGRMRRLFGSPTARAITQLARGKGRPGSRRRHWYQAALASRSSAYTRVRVCVDCYLPRAAMNPIRMKPAPMPIRSHAQSRRGECPARFPRESRRRRRGTRSCSRVPTQSADQPYSSSFLLTLEVVPKDPPGYASGGSSHARCRRTSAGPRLPAPRSAGNSRT